MGYCSEVEDPAALLRCFCLSYFHNLHYFAVSARTPPLVTKPGHEIVFFTWAFHILVFYENGRVSV